MIITILIILKKIFLKEKKILLLRSFASTKYLNDISIKCILELSKKDFFERFDRNMCFGEGILFEELTKLIKKFKNITINNNFLNHDEISKVHKNFGIFICPTRMDSQGCSMCEAMSSGLIKTRLNIYLYQTITTIDYNNFNYILPQYRNLLIVNMDFYVNQKNCEGNEELRINRKIIQ